MKVLVTGYPGQLARSIKDIYLNNIDYYSNFDLHVASKSSLDITDDIKKLANNISGYDVIINCAAYTAVDLAEDCTSEAYLVNATAPKILAKLTRELSIKLIHISTDFVFDGKQKRPYKETDIPNPLSIYGDSKYQGELAISQYAKDYIILRVSWLYSLFENNFLTTIKKLLKTKEIINVVSDQIGTPTSAWDLSKFLLDNINFSQKGIYHFSNQGSCSWYEFALAIKKFYGYKTKIVPISSKEYKRKAILPNFSVLDKEKICLDFACTIPLWKNSLQEMIHHNTNFR